MLFPIIMMTLLKAPSVRATPQTFDFIEKIKHLDASALFDSSRVEYDVDEPSHKKAKKPEYLGYCGDKMQRLLIHFSHVEKSMADSLAYQVRGKTKFKTNVCKFSGELKIKESRVYKETSLPGAKEGYLAGEYLIQEDSSCNGAGTFSGEFKSIFLLGKDGSPSLNTLNFGADGYSNNQFQGHWTSGKTKFQQECNWGLFRIPRSNKLDLGAGEFTPSADFDNYGWKTYRLLVLDRSDDPETQRAKRQESIEWWKQP